MIAWADLLAFATLGLLGSLHCAGMCGGFAIAVAAQSRKQALSLLAGQANYVLGKAVTYALLGLFFATMGEWLADLGHTGEARAQPGFSTARSALSWLVGAALIGMGCFHLGWRPKWTGSIIEFSRALSGPARRLFAGVRTLPGWSGAFGTGLLTGLLPCGLSWAAFLLASRCSPATALFGSFLFGLMTAPALLAVGLGSQWATARLRRHASPIVGIALLLFGGITVMRG